VVNVNWQLSVEGLADFEPPHSGSLNFSPGETLRSFSLSTKTDGLLEGEER